MDDPYVTQLENQVKQLTQALQAARAELASERQKHAVTESELRRHQAQLHQMLNSIEAGIAYVDADRRYRFVNRFYERRFNRHPDSMIGKPVWDVIGVVAYSSVKPYIDRVLAGEPQSFDFDITYPNGESAYIKCCLTPALTTNQQVNGYYLFVFDITPRRQLEESLKVANAELEELVSLDGLTQVANRRKFDEYLMESWNRALRYQESLSLIMLDIDFFKRYNDYYGHQAGDVCLISVAQTVKVTVQRSTDLVARYGGEEFAVILPNTDLAGTKLIAEQIRVAINALSIPHGQSMVSDTVTISLGIASLRPTTSIAPKQLVTTADQALYWAKQQGRDRCAVSPRSSIL